MDHSPGRDENKKYLKPPPRPYICIKFHPPQKWVAFHDPWKNRRTNIRGPLTFLPILPSFTGGKEFNGEIFDQPAVDFGQKMGEFLGKEPNVASWKKSAIVQSSFMVDFELPN